MVAVDINVLKMYNEINCINTDFHKYTYENKEYTITAVRSNIVNETWKVYYNYNLIFLFCNQGFMATYAI